MFTRINCLTAPMLLLGLVLQASTALAGVEQGGQRLPLDNTLNTRDLGGYTSDDGRHLKSGLLFRSDSIAHLSDRDLDTLAGLQLAVVTDFRSEGERAEAPDRLPTQNPPIRYRLQPMIDPGTDVVGLGRKVYSGQLSNEELLALTSRTALITDPDLRDRWGSWLRQLAEPGNLPQMFHCTAGKDRTGLGAALILLLLDVPQEQVMDDFLLSNQMLAPKIDASLASINAHSPVALDQDILRDVLGVRRESLEQVIALMESEYGSVDAFFEQGLGIDPATRTQIKNLLLE